MSGAHHRTRPSGTQPTLRRAAGLALGVGGVAGAGAVVAALVAPAAFFRAWLTAWLFWLAVPIGSLALLLIHHLTGGRWGVALRRPVEAGATTLPLFALLFVPLLFGLETLYPFAQPELVAHDHVLSFRAPYLNPPFWTARSVGYLAVWSAVAIGVGRLSLRQDRAFHRSRASRLRGLSAGGLIVLALTGLLASVDWVMALERHWFSTIWGLLVLVGQGLTALAFAALALVLLARRAPLAQLVDGDRLQDVGNLLLTFVMLWAYLAFSQYLITWSGDLPEEIPWYVHRREHGWPWVAGALVTLHFAAPFLLLLLRLVKRRAAWLAGVAAGLLVMRLVDWLWIVRPSIPPHRLALHAADLAAFAAVGGLFLGAWLWQLGRRALAPETALEGGGRSAAEEGP